jgi:hypothetical protein
VIVLVEGDHPFRTFEVDKDKRCHGVDYVHHELSHALFPVNFQAAKDEHHVPDL